MKINDILKESSVRIPVHKAFEYGGIKYDNSEGLGVVPNNSNVLYMGFAAAISAEEFLKLASKADREESAKKFADTIIDEDVAIASPFLSLEIEKNEKGAITNMYISGHEGRGRSSAIKMLSEGYRQDDQENPVSGDVVVHFFPTGGLRARHMDDSIFEYIKHYGIESQDGNQTQVTFKEVFIDKTWR